MKRLSLLVGVFLFASVLFPFKVFANEGLVDFQISPQGPLNPGDKYDLILTVYKDENRIELCKSCGVKLKFMDNDGVGQPGDEILPENKITDNDGQLKVAVTAYAVNAKIGGRQIYTEITLPGGAKTISSVVLLKYRDIPILAFVRLVTKLVSQGFKLPPMGNVYPIVTSQKYINYNERLISLEMNRPFGTKSYAIYVITEKDRQEATANGIETSTFGVWYQKHLVKMTTASKTEIKAPAFDNLEIDVLTCSVTNPDLTTITALPCVGPDFVALPKLEQENAATPSGTLSVPGDQGQKANIQKEQNQFNDFFSPLKYFLKGIYSKF